MKKEIMNMAASVKTRLQNKARELNKPYSELMQYYGMERFLYRFSKSKYLNSFFLKGALMFTVWNIPERRGTFDMDFLGHFDNQIKNIENVVRKICNTPVESDGLVFNISTIKSIRIKEDADYEGVRVNFTGFLEKSRIPMQIDIGFGDIVYPKLQSIEYPVILDFPHPLLKGYPIESVISEKFEAMVKLGSLNSRMKDFFDLWLIINQFKIRKNVLREAINRTFKNRKTKIPNQLPFFNKEILNESSDRQILWNAFLKKNKNMHAPKKLFQVAGSIQEFLVDCIITSKTAKQAYSRFHPRDEEFPASAKLKQE